MDFAQRQKLEASAAKHRGWHVVRNQLSECRHELTVLELNGHHNLLG
jgi:hypothetical protein